MVLESENAIYTTFLAVNGITAMISQGISGFFSDKKQGAPQALFVIILNHGIYKSRQ
jgi:hypothetical protein